MSDKSPGFSDKDRDSFRESVRRLLCAHWPVLTALERSADPKALRDIWRELGDLSVPELGGDAEIGGLREILLVFEELGRAACPAPLLGAVISNMIRAQGRKIPGADDKAVQGGDSPLHIAVGFGALDGDLAAGNVSISENHITGSVCFIEGTALAALHIVFLSDPCGVAIVDAGATGLEIHDTPGLSLPSLATLSFSNTPANFFAVPRSELSDLVQIARLCCSARALGSAQRSYELAVEHVCTRKQFGQLIGQFQAVQHRLVDTLIRLDGARLTLEAAATAFDNQLSTWPVFANLALAHSSPGLRQVALDMHQVFGAIGYAEEHELPRHFRQVHGNVTRFGGVLRSRAQLGAYLVGKTEAAA